MRAFYTIAICLVVAMPCRGKIIYLDEDGHVGFSNIQAAIDDARDGDVVILNPGTYIGPGNRDISYMGKAITVRSVDPNEPNVVSRTTVDCNGSESYPHRGFLFHHGEDSRSVLSGLTIKGGYGEDGGCIDCLSSSPTISKCVLMHNEGGYYGGAIHGHYDGLSKPVITECIIIENKAVIGGGLAFCNGPISQCVISNNQSGDGSGLMGCNGTITDCVISGNIARSSGGALQHCDGQVVNCVVGGNIGCGFFACNGTIRNCTVVGNTVDGFFACWEGPITNCIIRQNSRSQIQHYKMSAKYSNIEGGWPGEGNIDADPCFAQAGYWDPNGTADDASDDFWVNGDYHLKSQAGRWDPELGDWVIDDVTSGGIDAGDPMTPIGVEAFPNGGIVNIGAYGGTSEASKSYFDGPVCEIIVAGDINGDCAVNFLDFVIMALHWLDEH